MSHRKVSHAEINATVDINAKSVPHNVKTACFGKVEIRLQVLLDNAYRRTQWGFSAVCIQATVATHTKVDFLNRKKASESINRTYCFIYFF